MDTIAYRYKGPGAFYGIPSRDLTVEEFDALSPDLRRQVRLSGAYEPVTPEGANEEARLKAEQEQKAKDEAADDAKQKAADSKPAGKPSADKES